MADKRHWIPAFAGMTVKGKDKANVNGNDKGQTRSSASPSGLSSQQVTPAQAGVQWR